MKGIAIGAAEIGVFSCIILFYVLNILNFFFTFYFFRIRLMLCTLLFSQCLIYNFLIFMSTYVNTSTYRVLKLLLCPLRTYVPNAI